MEFVKILSKIAAKGKKNSENFVAVIVGVPDQKHYGAETPVSSKEIKKNGSA
jgi:hypothetical protein